MNTNFTEGQRVIIAESNHADVASGSAGVIDKKMEGGYSVQVEVQNSGLFGKKSSAELRCVFFAGRVLKAAPEGA